MNQGQFHARATQDSLARVLTMLGLQRELQLPVDRMRVALLDSLDGVLLAELSPSDSTDGQRHTPLPVAIATQAREATAAAVALERRRLLGVPAVSFGVERNTAGDQRLLPTIGLSLPLPLLNRRGDIEIAQAERGRAEVELEIATQNTRTAIAEAEQSATLAAQRLEQVRALLASAERVASLVLVAYREGAATMPTVLDAARRARELRDEAISATTDLINARAALRLYSTSDSTP